MNDLTVVLYLVMFAVVVGMTFAFMYTMMRTTLREFDFQDKQEMFIQRCEMCNQEMNYWFLMLMMMKMTMGISSLLENNVKILLNLFVINLIYTIM